MKIENIERAINNAKERLKKRFGKDIEFYLFGSVARGNYNPDSDIDILVLIPGKLTNSIEEEIFDITYDIELEYDVVFGVLVYSKNFWLSSRAQSMPLYQNILKEGRS